MSLEYTKSQKGFDLLKTDGYVYRKDKEDNGNIYSRCVECFTGKCRGRIIVSEGKIKKSTVHNHISHKAKIEKGDVIHNIKERAHVCQEANHQIVSAETYMLPETVCGQLPPIPLIKKAV